MTRKLGQLAAGLVGFAALVGVVTAADKKPAYDIETIMEKGHSGKKSLVAVIKAAVKEGKIADAEKPAAQLKEFGEALGANKPPKGPADSWKTLTAAYQKDTADLAAAVGKKDKPGAEAALAALGKSCMACHDVHQK